MNELLFIMEIGETEPLVQTDFFESWQMPRDDYYEAQEFETSEVSSACVTKKDEDNLDDVWLLEDYKPGNLQKEFAKIQPARTLCVGGKHENSKPDDHVIILNDRFPGDFTEDDEDWGSIIH